MESLGAGFLVCFPSDVLNGEPNKLSLSGFRSSTLLFPLLRRRTGIASSCGEAEPGGDVGVPPEWLLAVSFSEPESCERPKRRRRALGSFVLMLSVYKSRHEVPHAID